MPDVPSEATPNGKRWLSRDLTDLIRRLSETPDHIFDVVIVGSGYGGAMAAAELTGTRDGERAVNLCVLERGLEYTPGSFPSSLAELPVHVRVTRDGADSPIGEHEGLLDVRAGPDACVLLGNGLGGGSLINAGVMAIPQWSDEHHPQFPKTLRDALTPEFLQQVQQRLGARQGGCDNTISKHPNVARIGSLPKTQVLKSLNPSAFEEPALTVAMNDDASKGLSQCTLCGDCMTGCNVGAKISVDVSLLRQAVSQGAEVYTGASVLTIGRAVDLNTKSDRVWELSVVFTNASLRQRNEVCLVKTRKLILAAGALGSTEILLRSTATTNLCFSDQLGQRFSGNGDNIAALFKTRQRASATVQESVALDQRRVGPTITGRVNCTSPTGGYSFQEFAVPGGISRLFSEILTTYATLDQLTKGDFCAHKSATQADNPLDPCAVDPCAIQHSMMIGIIGHDSAQGRLRLPIVTPSSVSRTTYAGVTQVVWPGARDEPQHQQAMKMLSDLAATKKLLQPDGAVLANPLWQPLPTDMAKVIPVAKGPVLTVHPLGGCPMSDAPDTGVVDEYGRVFNLRPQSDDWFGSLIILDGSIMPGSVGTNPALTIAATACRAATHLRDHVWKWKLSPQPGVNHIGKRLSYRPMVDCTPQRSDTQVELIERLTGEITLSDGHPYQLELSLHFGAVALESLTSGLYRRLATAARAPDFPSTVRLFRLADWSGKRLQYANDTVRSRHAVLVASVHGGLTLLNRQASSPWLRTPRAFVGWVRNRGARDAISAWRDAVPEPPTVTGARRLLKGIFDKLVLSWHLASRAGEIRTLQYELTLGPISRNALALPIQSGQAISAQKKLGYGCLSNPVRQMSELTVRTFPSMSYGSIALLKFDNRFAAAEGVPLLQIVKQTDTVNSLMDMASLGLMFARILLNGHIWVFRAPDHPSPAVPTMLPGRIDGLPTPTVDTLLVDQTHSGHPVNVRLTRYQGRLAQSDSGHLPEGEYPLVLIHGYSVSGNTFTHDAIPTPMAKYFHDKGHDVWVLDLRTSAALPTAATAWAFEDAALADIPVAIAHILQVTGRPKVNVFAHCIGAVMVSMGILTDTDNWNHIVDHPGNPSNEQPKRYRREVLDLPNSIHRLILSQKGPALVYSDDNVLRAYLMRSLRHLVLPNNFQFRTGANASQWDVMLDRLLCALPYPDNESRRENPLNPFAKRPWVGLRHRMDLLYGMDFRTVNIDNKTLDAVSNLFGPLNLDTVAQAIHFAQNNCITNASGRAVFVTPQRMSTRWGCIGKTLSIHGTLNELVNVETLHVMQDLMAASGLAPRYQQYRCEGFGHQDCLIGTRAHVNFDVVEHFLRS